jgi:hypothetical protein
VRAAANKEGGLQVMQLDGWEDSRGIEMEIEAASKAGKTVVMWEDV